MTARLKQTVACQGHSWEAEQAEEQARAAAAAGQLPPPRAPPTDAECEALEQQLSTLARTVAQQRAEVLPMALQREVCLPMHKRRRCFVSDTHRTIGCDCRTVA